ncbi:CU044_5270 family protein [Streptomyces milbemycinicus]|uniref:CU044_5270 family protein n=1 Tax=Streptomyces milbemycinicus TaxID=476552 RepID=A0ABW8LSK1_9ACTN
MNDIPTLPERDLPPGRHRLLKEHLMREVRQADETRQADEVRRADAGTAEEPCRAWLRPAVAGPALAGALALAVVGGLAVTGADDGDGLRVGPDGTATYAFAPRVNGDTEDNAPEVLGRIATVAEKSSASATAEWKGDGGIRDDQYVYINSKVAFETQENGGPPKLDPLHRREVWLSVDGSRDGLLREPGRADNENQPLDPEPAPGKPGYDRSTSYRHLQTLPTDPGTMRKWIYATVERTRDPERSLDQDAFVLVGDLIGESLMPPKVSVALYRAAAEIPGVVVVPDAVDAAGRHGVAVARVDSGRSAIREELIFNQKTGEYLGERSVALEDADGHRAGQVTGTAAILDRAVVDKLDQRPQ